MSYLDKALVPSEDLGFCEFSVCFELLDLGLGEFRLVSSHFSDLLFKKIKQKTL